MPKQILVKGHTLFMEGRVWHSLRWQWGTGNGVGVCSCGKRSNPLPSTAARQRWHRDHKLEVLAAAIDERLAPPVEVEGKS